MRQNPEHTEKISAVMAFIDRNYWQPLTVEALARDAGLSKFHFIRVFKKECGVPPYRYITARRICEAKKRLRATNLKISEVSVKAGFHDECQFIRTFKNLTGMTPMQYRNSQGMETARDAEQFCSTK